MQYDRAKTAARGYGGRWQRERLAFLTHPDNALCVMCKRESRVTAATVVDHIIPHKGDYKLMWDRANWQPLCKPHHDSDKQSMDKGGNRQRNTIGINGRPTNASHPWNR